MKALDTQVGGGHYKQMKIQPVEFAMSNLLLFCEGCVVKYVTRWRTKGGIEDLRKARHFLDFLIEAPWYSVLLYKVRAAFLLPSDRMTYTEYIQENGISNPEAGVISGIWLWNNAGRMSDLEAASKWMDELIELAELEAGEVR